ncbi:MAG: phage minor head protein [Pyrinomonadaceae bacterium]
MPDAKNKSTAIIIGTGLLTAEVIASELRARLTKQLGDHWRYLSQFELIDRARNILTEFEPILAESIDRTTLSAWISGFDDVSNKLPPYILDTFGRMMGGPPKPPGGLILPAFEDDEPIVSFPMIEKAARSLLNRNVMNRAQFDRVSQDVKNQAFTIAGDISNDTLETIRDVLGETVDEGASLESFRRNLGERLEGSFAGPAYLENVFRTNVQTAFHDGHDALADNPIVAEAFPYQAYLAIRDARARPNHLALESLGLDGTNVYRRDDHAFWNLFTPAWDYQCRCGVNLMTIEAAARAGVSEAADWLRTGVRPVLFSRLPHIPFRPPAGFGARRAIAA